MDAARIKRARKRLRAYFLGSGVIMAFLFLIAASLVIRVLGVEQTSFAATLVFGAAAMAGGVYAIIFFAAVVVHIAKRVISRQPIMDAED